MQIKTFFGKNVQDAMNRAKAEFGDSVILFETKQLKQVVGDRDKDFIVQITAGADTEHEMVMPKPKVPEPVQKKEPTPRYFNAHMNSILDAPMATATKGSINEDIRTLQNDIRTLNDKLTHLEKTEFPFPYSIGYDKLVENGIREDHAAELIESTRNYLGEITATPTKVLGTLKNLIVQQLSLPTATKSRQSKAPEIVMVVGPSGVGKTTTIMKMAINPEIFGKKKVAILTTDAYRMAAAAPLKDFSKISKIPVFEIKQAAEALLTLDKLKDKDVIIVDTPGRNAAVPEFNEHLMSYNNALHPDKVFLALSAAMDLDDLTNAAKYYSPLNPDGLILTKLDETTKPAKLISIQHDLNLAITFVSGGQSIPDDIDHMSQQVIWTKILMTI